MENFSAMPGAVKKMLAHIRRTVPDVLAVYLYGSRALGLERKDSDWDLALLFPRGHSLNPKVLLQLNAELSKIAGSPVEASSLNAEEFLVHAKEVVADGAVLFSSDEESRLEFETRVLSNYARFCEDRRPILESYFPRHG